MKHGTISSYVHRKCRCLRCKKSWAIYRRKKNREAQAAGRCVSCTRKQSVRSIRFCDECLTAHNQNTLDGYYARRRNGYADQRNGAKQETSESVKESG